MERHCNNSDIKPVSTNCDIDSETYVSALPALLRLPYKNIYDAVKHVKCNSTKSDFAHFFNGL